MPDFTVHAVHANSIGGATAPISATTADNAALRDGLIGTSWDEAQHGEPYVAHSGVGPIGRIRVTVAWGSGSSAGAVQLEVEPI
jgi:hypothetical protein